MAKSIGALTRKMIEHIKARRQSTERWFIDRDGNVNLNRASFRRKPITAAEVDAINEAVRDFERQSRELH